MDGRIRGEFLPVFRHYRLQVTCQPPRRSTQLGFRRFGELQPAPPDAPAAQPYSSQPPSAPLPSHLARLCSDAKVYLTADVRISSKLPLKQRYQSCASRRAFVAGSARHRFDQCAVIRKKKTKITLYCKLLKNAPFPRRRDNKTVQILSDEARCPRQSTASLTPPPRFTAQLSAEPLFELRTARCCLRVSPPPRVKRCQFMATLKDISVGKRRVLVLKSAFRVSCRSGSSGRVRFICWKMASQIYR